MECLLKNEQRGKSSSQRLLTPAAPPIEEFHGVQSQRKMAHSLLQRLGYRTTRCLQPRWALILMIVGAQMLFLADHGFRAIAHDRWTRVIDQPWTEADGY